MINSEQTNPQWKFNGLQLLLDFVKCKQTGLITQLAKSDLYKKLMKYGSHKPNDKTEDRGYDLYGKQDIEGYST